MAHFQRPPNGDLGEYDVDSSLAVGSIWRMKTQVSAPGAEVALWGGAGLQVRSNNPAVIPNPLPPDRTSGDLRIFRLRGTSVGTTMLEAGPPGAPPWVSVQVQVVAELKGTSSADSMISLTKPHMALNASGTPVRYHRQHTQTVHRGVPASQIVERVRHAGPLKHLVISAHGQIDVNSSHEIVDSRIFLGTGFRRSDAELFSRLAAPLRGGVIWLGACVIGNDNPGNIQRARNAGCYVVAPIMYMQKKPGSSSDVPSGHMDMYPRFGPKVFTPNGGMLAWSQFLSMGASLGFHA